MGHLWLKWVGQLCYGSNGQGICDLIGWGSYGSVSYCFFLGDMLKKNHWSAGEYHFWSSHEHDFLSL